MRHLLEPLLPARARASVLVVVAVLATAGGVAIASAVQRHAASRSAALTHNTQLMLTAMLDQETAVRGYGLHRREEFLAPFRVGRAAFDRAVRAERRAAGRDAAVDRLIDQQVSIATQWQRLADQRVRRLSEGGQPTLAGSLVRKRLMDRFRQANATLERLVEQRRDASMRRAGVLAVAVILVLGGLFGAIGAAFIRRDRREREDKHRFLRSLSLAHTLDEALSVLRGHLERVLPGAAADVVVAPVPPSEADFVQPLVAREETLGHLTVQRQDAPGERDRARLEEVAATAAPALANLISLALAEERALTDPLTGLANKRAVDDALARLHAAALRNGTPMSVLLLDLDHFKAVNDTHGHHVGDEALRVTARTLEQSVRASDLVGRVGGEEFVVVLPDTGGDAAVTVANGLRAAIARARVDGLPDGMRASFGVARFPEHASDVEGLMRAADRALYAAKSLGRDRVEVADGLASPLRALGAAR